MRALVVREHERIPVLPENARFGERALSQQEVDGLLQICEQRKLRPFELGHRSVKFTQFCGVIQAAGVSIEILPKIANSDAFDRGALLRMLALAGDFPVGRLDGQKLTLQSHTLLQVLIRWFCDELFVQCHKGLLRAYVEHEDSLAMIRGRWRPDLDAQRFPGRKDRLCCEFDELTADNRYNRTLKAALRKARFLICGHEGLRRDIEILLAWFGAVSDVPATAQDIGRLPRNRLVARYERALMMAEWFLGNGAPELKTGQGEALSLLFDMNALFQSVLAGVLRKVVPDGFRVREEGPRYFLSHGSDGKPHFQMKPDLCVLRGDDVVAIIDAKWKRLEPGAPDGKWGANQADMYQLHAYAQAYECGQAALWYPAHEGLTARRDRPSFYFLHRGRLPTGDRVALDWIELNADPCDSVWLATLKVSVAAAFERVLLSSNEVGGLEAQMLGQLRQP